MTIAAAVLLMAFGFTVGLITAAILILATEDRDAPKRKRKTDR